MEIQQRKVYIDVRGPDCPEAGALEVVEALARALEKVGLSERVEIVESGCFGLCALAPNLYVEPDDVWYSQFSVQDVDEIVEQHLLKGKRIERLIHYPESAKQQEK